METVVGLAGEEATKSGAYPRSTGIPDLLWAESKLPVVAMRPIICAEGTPWPCEWATATVRCESSGLADAWATKVIDGIRYWFHGWFQIVSESPHPGPLADPVYNTERAAEKYRSEGPASAWPGCP